MITGKNYIGNQLSALGSKTYKTFNSQLNIENEHVFTEASSSEINAAANLAANAFKIYSKKSGKEKAAFLNAIADEIEALGEDLISTYTSESGLPAGRAMGERGRTIGQLKAFANHVAHGNWVDASIDKAQPDRQPLPKVDLRKMNVALGPIVVFGAAHKEGLIESYLANGRSICVITPTGLLEYLEDNIQKIADPEDAPLNKEACEFIAEANCRIKYDVVSRDEKEANLRQILNLGHTAGRAMETLFEYQLLHGECVAVGLSIQALLAHKLGLISDEDHSRIDALIALTGLPTEVPEEITTEKLVEKMYTDKKVRSGQIRFVLMNGIGDMKTFENASYTKALTDDFLISTIEEYRSCQSEY